MFLIGSPAGHGLFNVRLDQDTASDDVRFKEETFYSLCHATPPESAVAMTFSNGASGKLEYWSLPDTDPPRTVVVAPAWFAHYRPRRGLVTDWWLSGCGRLVCFACYIGELEADIFCDEGKRL